MFVRQSQWECRRESWGREAALFESGSVAVMERHKGFVRALLLAVPATTQRIAFTLWESEDDYRSFAASADLDEINETFSHMYVDGTAPRPREFEVIADSDTIGARTTRG